MNSKSETMFSRNTTRAKADVDSNKLILALSFVMCVLGAVFYCYEYFLRVAPSVMKLELALAYGISHAEFGHLAACYYYAYVAVQIPVGMLIDRHGPRRILTLACAMCALGTYIFAVTNSFLVAQVGRFLVGFGSAFAYVGVLKIATIWLPSRYFALIAGLCTALGMIGAISGQKVMAVCVELIGWRTTLYYSAFAGIILTVILWLFIRDNNDHAFATSRKKPARDHHKNLIASLKEITHNKQLWVNGTVGCLTFLPITIFAELWAVPYLSEAAHYDLAIATTGSALVFMGFALGGPFWGIISDKLQSRRLALIIGPFLSSGLALFVVSVPSVNYLFMYLALFFCGFTAAAQVLVFAVGNDISRPALSATTLAFTNMVVMIGGALLQPLIGKILDFYTTEDPTGLVSLDPVNYRIALMVLPIGLLVGSIISIFFLKETYQKDLNHKRKVSSQ